MIKNIVITFIIFFILFDKQLWSQSISKIDDVPFHTKVLWGDKGIIRKLKLAPKTRSSELRLRVQMLQLHQKIALGTLGVFSYQSYLGNQMLNGNYENWDLHSRLSKVVWVSYMSSAALSYFAPPAMKYSKKIDSMRIHRFLSWIHFSGMAVIPYLGYNIANSDDYNQAVSLHQTVALTTLGSMFLSAILSFIPY